jgi:3-keto-disaccharide hydrolase
MRELFFQFHARASFTPARTAAKLSVSRAAGAIRGSVVTSIGTFRSIWGVATMNKVCSLLAIVSLSAAVISFAAASSLAADDAKPDGAKDDGWISLFDGHSLKGWKASEHEWKVENGTIVASGLRSHLFYMGDDESKPAEFTDFDFKADVMTTPFSNSGIYFHTRFQESGFPQIGFEAQVNNTHGDPVKTGSIYHIVKNYVAPAKDNYWFTEEIVVQGKNIKTMVNGIIICDYTEPPGVTGPMEKINKGTFAFQAHDAKSTTYYKNIMVKLLPPKK